ncbi:LacI family DNA-binding transcriptional regulator [Tenacibaculum sp. 190524A05c]|uniref:LacI family DNA-binding transcriptional regulator n=1 Tax=Tenacibaculum platacis TaxID=3137852 RepID=UPI0032B1B3FC
MKKSITLKELAKLLKVSVSTVSKALNDSHEISESTKRKVEEAAKLHNYKPNRAALNLKSGKTNTIGVVLPSIKNFFLARALRGIESVIANTDYNIIISITNESHEKEVKSVEALTNGMVDGLIISVSEETQVLQEFSHLNEIPDDIHVLMFDRVENSVQCDKVLVDDYDAILKAVRDLKFKGRNKIVLASTINKLSVGQLRTRGYIDGIKDQHEPILIEGPEDFVEVKMNRLLQEQEIEAIIALDEEASLASFRAGKKNGVLENGKVFLIGYAGKTMSEHLTPSLTTIDQHGKKVGRTSAKLLLERLKKPKRDIQQIVVDSTLRERDTTLKRS